MAATAMEQMYQQVIIDHANNPLNHGLADAPEGARTAQSHQVNPTCGDEVTLRIVIGDDAQIEGITWEGQGCSISQASTSVMSDLVVGKSAEEAERLGEIFRALMRSRGQGLDEASEDELEDATAFTGTSKYPARIKCALLGWAALRDAMARGGIAVATENTELQDGNQRVR